MKRYSFIIVLLAMVQGMAGHTFEKELVFRFAPEDFTVDESVHYVNDEYKMAYNAEGYNLPCLRLWLYLPASQRVKDVKCQVDEAQYKTDVTLSWFQVGAQAPAHSSQTPKRASASGYNTEIDYEAGTNSFYFEIYPVTYFSTLSTLWLASEIRITLNIEEDDSIFQPLIREGRTWTCTDGSNRYTYSISGDTIRRASLYNKLYRTEADGTRHMVGAVREEGRRVYLYSSNDDTERTIYDFLASTADWQDPYTSPYINFRYNKPSLWFGYYILDTLSSSRTVEAEGVIRRYEHLSTKHWKGKDDNISHFLWIEGLGTLYNPFKPSSWQTQDEQLLTCYDADGTCLYDSTHGMTFSTKDGIEAMENGKSIMDNAIFDLSGRRLAAPPARGLYIEDGKVVRQTHQK